MELLSAEHITFGYGQTHVLHDLSLSLNAGEVLRLHGASGAGKTTLLRLLARLELPRRGMMLYGGEPYEQLDAQLLRRSVAYLQQVPVIFPGCVHTNLTLSLRFDREPPVPPDREDLRAMLRDVALDPEEIALSHPARELSVGQQQRIALLRLLLMQPRVLLLDEPVAALDGAAVTAVAGVLARFLETGNTAIVMASHQDVVIPGAVQRTMDMHRHTFFETYA